VRAEPASDDQLLAAAKATLASQIERTLPATPIESWLVALVGPQASPSWSINDCGEQAGVPETDTARDLPICGELAAQLSQGRSVSLYCLVGTEARGVVETRALYFAGVVAGDETKSFRTLSQLASYLRPHVPSH